jgi:hypothetical protein
MPGHELIEIFVRPLNGLGIRYMVTGAVASIMYGEPRLTNDIDLVVEIHQDQAETLVRVFPPQEFYCPPAEVIKLEAGRSLRGHFNIIHHETGLKADLYTKGKDELHEWAMANRKKLELGGEAIWVAPPEYVIIRKLEYYREGGSEKHMKDIEAMLELSSDQIDFQELEQRIRALSLEKEWNQVLEKKQ